MVQIIGAGYGRTGTMSTRAALDQLGYGPIYHMAEILNEPEPPLPVKLMTRIMKFDVTKMTSQPNAGGRHASMWTEAWHQKQAENDEQCKKILSEILDGYKSTLDWPACKFYKELHEMYPEALVLLSVRDSPQAFAKSVTSSVGPLENYAAGLFHRIPAIMTGIMRADWLEMIKTVVCEGEPVATRVDNKLVEEDYIRHVAAVEATVRPESLLVFNVKQGWAPLCERLNVAVPDGKFPRINDSKSMQNVLFSIKVLDTAIWVSIGFTIGLLSDLLK